MAETLVIAKGNKEEKYQTLLPQIKSLIEGESDFIANLANITAAIKDTFDHFWVGFYIIRPALKATKDNPSELVLGPFQGPIACTRIRKGKGVCGTAWLKSETQIVPDVELFPGHIACSSRSRSEIVVPIYKCNDEVSAILDIDSEEVGTFDQTDAQYLEEVCRMISTMI
ncbi:MAG: GAF domain-containing protein [Porphyromonadaceae bacterium]|nr:GAF domain-containing protein [Porphyromonadaceae bacterium]